MSSLGRPAILANRTPERRLGEHEGLRLLALSRVGQDSADRRPAGSRAPPDPAVARTAFLAALAGVLAIAAFRWLPDRHERQQDFHAASTNVSGSGGSVSDGGRSAVSRQDLKEHRMRSLALALATAPIVASSASAQSPPAGYLLVADSVTQFTGVQGQNGWRYRYDRGPGTTMFDMAHFSPAANVWSATPTWGGSSGSLDTSHCFMHASGGHPNTPSPCLTPSQGAMRPIREWTPSINGPFRLVLIASVNPGTANGVRFDLMSDQTGLWSQTLGPASPPVTVWLDIDLPGPIRLRADGLGNCGGDGFGTEVRIYAPDCDGNQVPDATQIALAPGLDANGNLRLDCCEGTYPCCSTDLFPNRKTDGADLAILLSQWGPSTPQTVCDFNLSGSVDGSDLATLLAAWGPCPQ